MARQNQRYFVRLDSNGKPVLGSLVGRKAAPKTGTWLEITGYCCAPTTTTTTTSTTTTTTTTIV